MPGPFTRSWGSNLSQSPFAKERTWSTSASKPYVKPLAFSMREGRCSWTPNYGTGSRGEPPLSYTQYHTQFPGYQSVDNRVAQKLYAKLGDKSMWAVNLLERKQSISMIAKRCVQLRRAFTLVRRGKFGQAAKVLGIRTPKGARRDLQLSNNWLEFHFGWVPLLQDIGAAVKTLQDPPPIGKIQASGRGFDHHTYAWPATPGGNTGQNETSWYSVRTCFTVKMVNPDLYLANQLGFTNPALIAWETVPFSFVVDWFIPIGEFLSQMTATLGLQVTDGFTGRKVTHTRVVDFYVWEFLQGRWQYVRYTYEGIGIWAYRTLGALSTVPSLPSSVSFSPTRALTALTLLVQQFVKR